MQPTIDDAYTTMVAEAGDGRQGWRPVRAAALLAVADAEDRVWMTLAEFMLWRERMGILGARNIYPKLRDLIGMGEMRAKSIMGGAAISRMEALACAHALFGMTAPIEPGDADVFAEWFQSRFAIARPVANFLRCSETLITDRIRGYRVQGDKRIPRSPEIDMIRALDWIDTMGPWSPFGERPAIKTWPTQEVF